MISEQYIYDWMVNKKGLKESVAKTNRGRIKRIDEVYNLFYAYMNDGCAYVLSLFEYSKNDEKNGLLPEHDIIIDGNYYTGTQSLKYALNLYIEAMEDDDYFDAWMKSATLAEQSDGNQDVSADDFNKLISSFRNMGSISDAKVHEMLREGAAESAEDATSAAAIALTPVSGSPIVFTGDLQAFLRYVGPFCKNYVNSITKSARNKHNGICEYCGSKSVLDSAHRDGEDRPIIIQKILETHFKKSENYYEVDILKFEKIFKDSHMPVEDHIFFLCKKCHTEYDRGTKITTADILAKRKP